MLIQGELVSFQGELDHKTQIRELIAQLFGNMVADTEPNKIELSPLSLNIEALSLSEKWPPVYAVYPPNFVSNFELVREEKTYKQGWQTFVLDLNPASNIELDHRSLKLMIKKTGRVHFFPQAKASNVEVHLYKNPNARIIKAARGFSAVIDNQPGRVELEDVEPDFMVVFLGFSAAMIGESRYGGFVHASVPISPPQSQ